jgi:hypothetical protein
MSTRLQVIMDESELEAVRTAAQQEGMNVSEWVRAALRRARATSSSGDVERKLAAIRAAARHEFPTADIDQMLAEIESGYGGNS